MKNQDDIEDEEAGKNSVIANVFSPIIQSDLKLK